MADDCIFCKVVRGEIPATIVASNETCIAFRDVGPQAPVHVLVIPREHVRSVSDASAAVLGEVMGLAQVVAEQEGVAGPGYRVVFNTGVDGGQTVGHLHAHVLGGRRMKWPPG